MTDCKQKCLARLRFIQILIDNSCLFNFPYRASIVLYVIPVKSKKINPPTYRTCLARIYEEVVYNKIHKFQKKFKILQFTLMLVNMRVCVCICFCMCAYVRVRVLRKCFGHLCLSQLNIFACVV